MKIKANVRVRGFILIIGALLLGLYSCTDELKTVVYINSYHADFPPSQQITKGVLDKLPSDSFAVRSYFMDSKRNPSESFIRQRADALLDSIRSDPPDVLIVSDDNALKYLVVPHYQDHPQPIVFCGVNWSADQYDLAGCNITGILEILPLVELVQTLRPCYPGMTKLLVLNENTTTSRKTQAILDTLLGNQGLEVTQLLVDDFESWKSAFKHANESFDLIYLQTKGAIDGWEDEAAREHVEAFIRIPVVTCEEFMMPFCVLGLTQLSQEQGIKAAEMAKRIAYGTDPSAIPIAKNTRSKVWINPKLANRIGFEPGEELRKRMMEYHFQ
jgi:ABC-type uncharacterized transport system substrate-binding protein